MNIKAFQGEGFHCQDDNTTISSCYLVSWVQIVVHKRSGTHIIIMSRCLCNWEVVVQTACILLVLLPDHKGLMIISNTPRLVTYMNDSSSIRFKNASGIMRVELAFILYCCLFYWPHSLPDTKKCFIIDES